MASKEGHLRTRESDRLLFSPRIGSKRLIGDWAWEELDGAGAKQATTGLTDTDSGVPKPEILEFHGIQSNPIKLS